MRITKEHTIGLGIDIQERLFPVMHNKKELLKNCEILIKGFEVLGIPTLFTQQYTKGLGETLPEIKTAISDFDFREKRDFSCCDDHEVTWKFKELGAKNIVLFGIEAHVCVLQTAVDMKDSGLNPIVVTDCISSRTPENIETAKERFRYENIMTTSYETILFELTRSSTVDEFKAISKLVR